MDVLNCIDKIPAATFSLRDVYSFVPSLKARHPENNNIEAKIRQQLQFLRDKGFIQFLSPGKYKKTRNIPFPVLQSFLPVYTK